MGAYELDDLRGDDPARGDIGVGQDHRELVAAYAGDDVALAQARSQRTGDGHQDIVSGRVAEAVVDLLEAVEVEHEQRAHALVPPRAADLARQLLLEAPPGVEPGQRVVVGEMLQPGLEDLALGDVDGLQQDQQAAVGVVGQ